MKQKSHRVSRALALPLFLVGMLAGAAMAADRDGLIAYWPLDEGQGVIAHDGSGHGNDGYVEGAAWVSGYCGSALRITGTSLVDWIPYTFDDPIQQGMSVASWVYWGGPSEYNRASVILDGRDGLDGLWFGIMIPSGFVRLNLYAPGGNEGVEGLIRVPQGGWTHVAGVYDSGAHHLLVYVNGQLDQSAAAPEPYHDSFDFAAIGNNHWAPGDGQWAPLNGTVDELRLYNRALSQPEIQELLNCPSPTPTAARSWGLIKSMYRTGQ